MVAALTRRFGDLDIAEEAAAEAFATAVERWPADGVPPNPGAWLTTTATRRAIDRVRRESKRDDKHKEAQMVYDVDPPEPVGAIDDERLRLIFTCCHPALSMETRVALTLRMVGGLTVPEIARAFLVQEPAMGQRITRAKAKIKAARIPYRVPSAEDLPARVSGVLAVLFLVFNEGYLATGPIKEWQGEVVFLHEVVPGAADRSYGIQVAQLAGLPAGDRAGQGRARQARSRGPRRAARLRGPAAVRGGAASRRWPAANNRLGGCPCRAGGARSRRDVAARGARGALCAQGQGWERPSPDRQAAQAVRARTCRASHSIAFQAMQIASPVASAHHEPIAGAGKCTARKPKPRPIKGTCACASTLAAALPPTRGCRITMKLPITTGNTANIPEANEPMRWLAVVTTATTNAAVKARSGMS